MNVAVGNFSSAIGWAGTRHHRNWGRAGRQHARQGIPDGGNDVLSFYAFGDITSRVGVTVAAGNTDPFISDQIFVAYNTSTTSMITGYEGQTGQIVGTADAFPAGYTDSINMAVGLVNLNGVSGDLVVVAGDGLDQPSSPRVLRKHPRPGTGQRAVKMKK